jgi:hypothetical protein
VSFLYKAYEAITDALEQVRDLLADYFGDTEPVETLRIESEAGIPLPPVGVLKDMGYRVGQKGLLPRERREILRRTFRVPTRCHLAVDEGVREDLTVQSPALLLQIGYNVCAEFEKNWDPRFIAEDVVSAVT